MAIALVGTPTAFEPTAAVTTVTNSVPTGVANGHFLFWQVTGTNATAPTTPTGWTAGPATTTTGHSTYTYYRIASSEPASYNMTVTSARWTGLMSAWSGVDNTTPLDVAAPSGIAGTTAITCPAITPVTSGAVVLGIGGSVVGSGVTNGAITSSNTTIAGSATTKAGAATNAVTGVGYASWTSGAFTPTMATSQTTTRTEGMTIALRPASGTDATVNAVTGTASSTAPAPAVSAGSSVTSPVGSASSAGAAPAVSAGSSVTAVKGTASGVSVAPAVTASSGPTAAAASASTALLTPAVSAGATVTAPVATATALMNAPVVVQSVNATVNAVVATAQAAALAPAVSGYVPIYFFPPVGYESSSDPFFGRYRVQVGFSVIKKNGHFVTEPYPWMGELVGLAEGTDYFLGGRLYIVSADVAAALQADGFEMTVPDTDNPPTDPPGFGDGGFGEGAFGA